MADTKQRDGCEWVYDEYHDMWDTQCDNGHCFIEGTPKDNFYEYCPYCGKVLIQSKPSKLSNTKSRKAGKGGGNG